ncbi:hypothetical protein BDA99DRAFT_219431 [Phascolomyces articulosus]|uniref:Uncharacterized protein n=1 Tax=Phascolomyces articulosus TaxID=60185 RepID=A0AAD5JQA5_9FUNG|nr:hypothetical protein BDA99DRAFT_219431 [Phascolomyces articulosus]
MKQETCSLQDGILEGEKKIYCFSPSSHVCWFSTHTNTRNQLIIQHLNNQLVAGQPTKINKLFTILQFSWRRRRDTQSPSGSKGWKIGYSVCDDEAVKRKRLEKSIIYIYLSPLQKKNIPSKLSFPLLSSNDIKVSNIVDKRQHSNRRCQFSTTKT